ncbi:MAG: exonuclease subunit SbcD [Planctomycetaceae bacterium]|jgi:exonuclease SbcD|nr:exonuclease subunit SbcD [Planctomycetaceae bacterium]
MKIIHTADLHIGQTFHSHSRQNDHLHFFAQLKSLIAERQTDVVLVAGDVFDTANPSAEAQSLFYRFISDAVRENPGLQIVITAGNHDSAARLEAPNPLLESWNVTVRGTVKRNADGTIDYRNLVIPLMVKGAPAGWCLAVPYLRQGDYPPAEDYSQGIEMFYRGLYEAVTDKSLPVIAMGHLHAASADCSKDDRSEHPIGGIEGVSPSAFLPEFAYTALGHLHRPQQVGRRKNVRYCGAPLPMSFAEIKYRRGVTELTLDTNGIQIEHIEMEPLAALQRITAESVDEALEQLRQLPKADDFPPDTLPFLEVAVKWNGPDPALRYKVDEVLKDKAVRLARLDYTPPKPDGGSEPMVFAEMQTRDAKELVIEIAQKEYNRKYGSDLPSAMQTLLQEVISGII